MSTLYYPYKSMSNNKAHQMKKMIQRKPTSSKFPRITNSLIRTDSYDRKNKKRDSEKNFINMMKLNQPNELVLHEKIKLIRIVEGLSRDELGNQLDISKRTLESLENKGTDPSRISFRKTVYCIS